MIVRNDPDTIYKKVGRAMPGAVRPIYENLQMEYAHARMDKRYKDEIARTIQETSAEKPSWVEIETINRCNGTCAFCPIHHGVDVRPLQRMSDELFHKIIDDLAAIGYAGMIALFCNNEPFLDPKIVERIEYVRKSLPGAYVYLYTNGTLLTPEKFEQVIGNLDILIIDNYSSDNTMNPSVKKLWDMYGCDKYDNAVIWMRIADQVLSTRGGEAPNRFDRKILNIPIKSSCVMLSQHMYVHPDGKIGLCCQDAVWRGPTLGDLSKQTVLEAWNGPEYTKLREHFKNCGDRSKVPVCRECDFLTSGKHPGKDIFKF